MKKFLFSFCLALTAVLALNAEDYTGTIYVTRNGQTNSENVTVNVNEQSNGLYTLVLHAPFTYLNYTTNLTLTMTDVPSATTDGITTFSAERNVNTGTFGNMYTIVFARVTDGMMAANVSIPAYGVTMWFNTVGNHFQLPNSDFEAWTASTGEPDRWHGFMSAYGNATLVSTSQSLVKLNKSEDVHYGTNGTYSAMMTSGSTFGIIANGTMTNGRLKAGSISATSTDNHAEMDKDKTDTDANGDRFYMRLYSRPDKFNVWLKYTQGSTNAENKASVSVKTFDGTYYQEPTDKNYTNLSGSIVGGQIPAGDWTQYSFPFDYESYAANNAATEAIFVTFSTNGNPGQGSSGDKLFVDDMELVYLGKMTDLRYKGVTIDGWDPEVTAYSMEIAGEPNLDDFTATIEGVSAVLTKSMEQNADGSYRIAISVVAGDLQTATCYIITATEPTIQFKKGDVNNDGSVSIADVTALIDYLLSGNAEGLNLLAADVDENESVTIADVTALIDMLLSGE